jgi:hypothetical protein
VLNKIDALWDELRSPAGERRRDRAPAAARPQLLGVPETQVFPVSAQKALVGKINGDMGLFEKSRLGLLESALFNELIPARQDILRRQLRDDMSALLAASRRCWARAGATWSSSCRSCKACAARTRA